MTTRDKVLRITRNHQTNGFAIELHREYERNGQWWPEDPVATDMQSTEFVDFATVFNADAVAAVAELKSQLSAAIARIAALEAALPWNPRVMEAKHFVARITPNEMLTLAGSTDATVQAILGMLKEWVAKDWPVVLESPEMQQAIGYLGQIGMVTSERVAELLRDCSQSEAYIADGN